VVVISGPRQSGKTTLSRQAATKNDTFITFDDPILLAAALDDPKGFVNHPKGTLILDEIQKAPSLLLAIKQAVAISNRKGQYLLTGSADIRTLPAINDSLAGRIAHIRLRTLTAGEVLGKQATFLKKAFKQDWPRQIKGYDKAAVVNLAMRGGYPEFVRLPESKRRHGWHNEYVKSLLSRDLRDVANIQRQDSVENVLNVLAAWSSKLMDVSAICGKLAIARKTFDSYANALISLCIFERLPPWSRTDYERAGRKDKIFATDTGLMSSILRWHEKDALLDPDKSGKIVESFVFNELRAQIDLDYNYSLYQYRDRVGREIDFLVENGDGALLGVEVKAGSAVSKDDFKHMTWFKHNIVTDKEFIGVVLYAGENVLPFGPDMYAIPIAALWT
jgi:predicted AAA+ superfamily ATPase